MSKQVINKTLQCVLSQEKSSTRVLLVYIYVHCSGVLQHATIYTLCACVLFPLYHCNLPTIVYYYFLIKERHCVPYASIGTT